MLWLLAASVVGCQAHDVAERAPEGVGSDACAALAGETVRFIVPYSAGGGYDVYARLLTPFYEDALGASIVVENRTGAGGRLGSRLVRDAEPDGRTLGIVNAFSLIVMGLAEGVTGVDPVDDFTVLGRVAVADPVWVTRPESGFTSIEDVLAARDGRPILFGLNDVSGTAFVAASVGAELLGLDVNYILGYPGTRENSIGLMRGEFDVGAFTFESIRDRVEAGDLVPLLRISDVGAGSHPSLADVPVLSGRDGLAARLARERGEDAEAAVTRAAALSRMFEAGRLVVAPSGLAPDLAECLSARLARVVRDSEFRAAAQRAGRSLAFADPTTLVAELEATEEERASLGEVLRHHAALARNGGLPTLNVLAGAPGRGS
jgi:tripartite-type tricarboxylate transporter receptor subunit TctC